MSRALRTVCGLAIGANVMAFVYWFPTLYVYSGTGTAMFLPALLSLAPALALIALVWLLIARR